MTEKRISCFANFLAYLAIVLNRDMIELDVLVDLPDGSREDTGGAGPALHRFHHFRADHQVHLRIVFVVHIWIKTLDQRSIHCFRYKRRTRVFRDQEYGFKDHMSMNFEVKEIWIQS